MQAIRSKSTHFVERWSTAEFLNTRLFAIASILAGACVILCLGMVFLISRPMPIYYIPNGWQSGKAVPVTNLSAVAGPFAVSFVLDWNNFNPSTYEESKKRARRLMTPNFYAKTYVQLKKNMGDITKDEISSSFILIEDPVVTNDQKDFWVTVKGKQSIYIGKQVVKDHPLTVMVKVKSSSPTDSNPFGLLIDDLEEEGAS